MIDCSRRPPAKLTQLSLLFFSFAGILSLALAVLGFSLKEAGVSYIAEHRCLPVLTGELYMCQVGPGIVKASDMPSVAWAYRLKKLAN